MGIGHGHAVSQSSRPGRLAVSVAAAGRTRGKPITYIPHLQLNKDALKECMLHAALFEAAWPCQCHPPAALMFRAQGLYSMMQSTPANHLNISKSCIDHDCPVSAALH